MLLTRSPLSPGPKPWFSLDLHVLSAPPAFVLSQDQTLREDLMSGEPDKASFELELKGPPLVKLGADGFLIPPVSRQVCGRAREVST